MYFSIDRIIGGKAELIGEDKKPLTVPVDMLPNGARAGDMLFYGKYGFSLAPDKTAERRGRVADMLGILLNQADEPQDAPQAEPQDGQQDTPLEE